MPGMVNAFALRSSRVGVIALLYRLPPLVIVGVFCISREAPILLFWTRRYLYQDFVHYEVKERTKPRPVDFALRRIHPEGISHIK